MRSYLSLINTWFYWTLCCALGVAVTYPLIVLITTFMMGRVFPGVLSAVLFSGAPLGGALGGAISGLCQAWLFRRWRKDVWLWVLTTSFGWAIGLFSAVSVFTWLLPDGINYMTLITPFAVGGAVNGVFQMSYLQRWVPGAGWWIASNAMGWVLGWVVVLSTIGNYSQSIDLTPGVFIAVIGAAHGLIIGIENGLVLVLMFILSGDRRLVGIAQPTGLG